MSPRGWTHGTRTRASGSAGRDLRATLFFVIESGTASVSSDGGAARALGPRGDCLRRDRAGGERPPDGDGDRVLAARLLRALGRRLQAPRARAAPGGREHPAGRHRPARQPPSLPRAPGTTGADAVAVRASSRVAAVKTSSEEEYSDVKSTAPFSSSTTHPPSTGEGGRFRRGPVPATVAQARASSQASGGGWGGASRRAPSAMFVRHSPGAARRRIAPTTRPPAIRIRRSYPRSGTSSCTSAPWAANHGNSSTRSSSRARASSSEHRTTSPAPAPEAGLDDSRPDERGPARSVRHAPRARVRGTRPLEESGGDQLVVRRDEGARRVQDANPARLELGRETGGRRRSRPARDGRPGGRPRRPRGPATAPPRPAWPRSIPRRPRGRGGHSSRSLRWRRGRSASSIFGGCLGHRTIGFTTPAPSRDRSDPVRRDAWASPQTRSTFTTWIHSFTVRRPHP